MRRKIKQNYVRLPLKKAYNVRDLGGYAGTGKKQTRFHAFLRTDDLSETTKEDQEFLKAYGVTAALDLRSKDEAENYPNPFREDPEVNYINIPFITEDIQDVRKLQEFGFHVPKFYIDLIELHEYVYQIMTFIAKQKGCVLFHCMAGKDRTGVTAMLLLGLAGVAKEDIVANYQVTRTYLENYVDLHLREELKDLEYSRPEWIAEAYDYLIETYGSFEDYLLAVGLSQKTIKKVKRHLI
jgi:protein-tyrosine phosphatase